MRVLDFNSAFIEPILAQRKKTTIRVSGPKDTDNYSTLVPGKLVLANSIAITKHVGVILSLCFFVLSLCFFENRRDGIGLLLRSNLIIMKGIMNMKTIKNFQKQGQHRLPGRFLGNVPRCQQSVRETPAYGREFQAVFGADRRGCFIGGYTRQQGAAGCMYMS